MDTKPNTQMATGEDTEQRLIKLGVNLPAPPAPFGMYVESVRTGNLLFLTGMLPTEGQHAKFTGRVGAELDTEADARLPASRRSMPLPWRGNIWEPSAR